METESKGKAINVYSLILVVLVYLTFLSAFGTSYFSQTDALVGQAVIRVLFLFLLLALIPVSFPKTSKPSLVILPFFLLPFSNLLYGLCFGSYWVSSGFGLASLLLHLLDCLITAFVEEWIFRHMALMNRQGWKALLLSSVLFALPHLLGASSFAGGLAQAGYTFLLGLCLGFVYLYGGGFIYCFALHFLFNLINGYLAPTLFSYGSGIVYVIYSLVFGLVILVYFGFLLYRKNIIGRRR